MGKIDGAAVISQIYCGLLETCQPGLCPGSSEVLRKSRSVIRKYLGCSLRYWIILTPIDSLMQQILSMITRLAKLVFPRRPELTRLALSNHFMPPGLWLAFSAR